MGRPRSTQAQDKVLKAAIELMAENGIEGTSMDAVARVSGVSKATVYKHWKTKEDLCLEAIIRVQDEVPTFATGNPRADITEFLRHLSQRVRTETLGQIWPRIVGYAAGNPEFAKAWRDHITEPSRAQLIRLLKQAISQGELRADLDIELARDLLVGPIMHRRFVYSAVPRDLPKRVVEAFWQLYGITSPAPLPEKSTPPVPGRGKSAN